MTDNLYRSHFYGKASSDLTVRNYNGYGEFYISTYKS